MKEGVFLNIFLIRHGQTDINLKGRYQGLVDVDLNEAGILQAELTGKRISEYNIKYIYSSELKRAVQTSEIIKKYVNVNEVIIKHELREIEMGQWEDKTWKEIKEGNNEYFKNWSMHLRDLPYPGGESGKDVINRSFKIIDEIIHKNIDSAVIVSHGGVIKVLLSYFLGLPQEKRFNMEIKNCSVSLVKYDKNLKLFKVFYIDDYSHLHSRQLDTH